MKELTEKQKNKFLNNFIQGNKNECWEWLAAKTNGGYGQICGLGLTHRVSYKFFVGPIPKGLFVLHKCDNPSCVNPNHLFLGTQRDNMQDMSKKDRSLKGEKNYWFGKDHSGEKNGMFGKHHKEESNQKNREKHLGKNNGEKCHFFSEDHSGEKGPNHKLKNEDIIEIRNSNLKLKDLAEKFNISYSSIMNIKHFRTWKNVK
ncbi:HNH endonuclease [Candidatus Dojkabacteria bacterium]|jgi:hypothetical protein|nr:HNH endonuclease [Candidatus Dojkabacteria bacterium]